MASFSKILLVWRQVSSISLQVLAYKHLIYLVLLHFTHKQLENTHNVLYVLAKAQDLGTARGKTKSHNHIGIIIVSQHTTCTGSSVLFGNLSVFVFVFLAFFHFPQLSSQTFFKLLKLQTPSSHHLPPSLSSCQSAFICLNLAPLPSQDSHS